MSIIQKTATNIKIGELLVQAGMLSQNQLSEVVKHAGGKRLQLGQMLVMYGYLKAPDLQAALDAQSMIRDKRIDLGSAIKCLKVAYKTGSTFVAVLAEHEGHGVTKAPTGRLGELLLEARVISTDEFAKALQRSLTTGLPLGRMLVLNQVLTEEQLGQALEVQMRLRDDMITRDEAINALQITARPGFGMHPSEDRSADQPSAASMVPQAPRRRGVRLGELMVLGGAITETDVMNALELGLLNHKPIGEVLVEKNLVSQYLIDSALELQKRIDDLSLTVAQASECLARIRSTNCTIDEALEQTKEDPSIDKDVIGYEKLLTLARVVTNDDIDNAFDLSSKSAQIIGRVLLLTGFIDEPTMQATLRCHQLLQRGWLTQDDAIASLHYCLRQKDRAQTFNFDDALRELGWQANKPIFDFETGGASIHSSSSSTDAADSSASAVSDLNEENSAPRVNAEAAFASAEANITFDPASGGDSSHENSAPSSDSGTEQDFSSATTDDATKSLNLEKSSGRKKQGKHTDTISPEDPNAQRIAMLVNAQISAEKESARVGPGKKSLLESFAQLAMSYYEQGNFSESQMLYERILVHRLKELGPNHVALVGDLRNLAGVLCAQGKFNPAEAFMRRVVTILEGNQPLDEAALSDALSIVGGIYYQQEKYAEAAKVCDRALSIRRRIFEDKHPDLLDSMVDYAKVLKKLNRVEEAERLYEEAKS